MALSKSEPEMNLQWLWDTILEARWTEQTNKLIKTMKWVELGSGASCLVIMPKL